MRANQGEDFIDPCDQHRPEGCGIGRRLGSSLRSAFIGRRLIGGRDFSVSWQSGIGRHSLAKWRVGRQNTMISMAMLAWRWYQHSELIQKLQGREIENCLPARHRFWETIHQSLILLDPLQPLVTTGCPCPPPQGAALRAFKSAPGGFVAKMGRAQERSKRSNLARSHAETVMLAFRSIRKGYGLVRAKKKLREAQLLSGGEVMLSKRRFIICPT